MTNKINGSDTFHSLDQIELELLQALLEPEDICYPWNPADEESESYFHQLEQQFAMQDVLDEELTTRSEDFYGKLDTLWSKISTSPDDNCNTSRTTTINLLKSLQSAFAKSVPQSWLNAIAHTASEIFDTQQSLDERLVACVQSLLPAWQSEDLLVLASPLAFPMRGSEPHSVTSAHATIDNREWTALSPTEQAKVSLAIAHYAWTQLNSFGSKT